MTLKLLFFLLYFINVDCARILGIFPIPSISHQVVFRSIYNELVNRGHEVVVITPNPMYKPDEAPSNLREIDIHDVSYSVWAEHWLKLDVGEASDLWVQNKILLQVFQNLFLEQIKIKEVQKLISDNKDKYDLLLLEAAFTPIIAFTHLFKAPAVWISSSGGILNNYEVVGVPTHPILFPSLFSRKILNHTRWEKIQEFYIDWRLQDFFETYMEKQDKMLKEIFGGDMPPSKELFNNVQMLFVNNYPIWLNNRPVPPSVIHMGGIHQKPQKDLPEDIENYLNASEHGVIFFSFGTNANLSMIPPQTINIFTTVFSKLPYNVLWKWDFDVLPGQTKNIRISKWMPQADILRHKKIKLFITQGGLQSTDEAITAGVPLIGIPMLADQWYNVEKYVEYKIGLRLDLFTLNEDEFERAIREVIENKSYRQNIENLRSIIMDQPQKPMERTIWWLEHVLRHKGAKHLRTPSANMSVSEYYEFNIIITVFAIILAIILIILFIIYESYKLIINQKYSKHKIN